MNETGGPAVIMVTGHRRIRGTCTVGLGWVTLWCGPAGQFVLSMNWVSSNFVGVVKEQRKTRGKTWRGPGHWDGSSLSLLDPLTGTDTLQLNCYGWMKVVNLQRVGSEVRAESDGLGYCFLGTQTRLPGSPLPKWSWVNVSVRFMIQLSEAKEKC